MIGCHSAGELKSEVGFSAPGSARQTIVKPGSQSRQNLIQARERCQLAAEKDFSLWPLFRLLRDLSYQFADWCQLFAKSLLLDL